VNNTAVYCTNFTSLRS